MDKYAVFSLMDNYLCETAAQEGMGTVFSDDKLIAFTGKAKGELKYL